MTNHDALSLDSRRRIYEFVQEHPGTHLREIARSLDTPLGTALYHLAYLEDSDLIVVRRDGRYKRFFDKHAMGRREKDYVSAFHHGVPRRIATVLLATGKRTQRELADAVGVSRSTLSFHLNKMIDGGILDCEEMWPENTYEVTDQDVASRVLVRYRDSFADDLSDRFAELITRLDAANGDAAHHHTHEGLQQERAVTPAGLDD